MWNKIVRLILRNRLAILIIIGLITCFLGYHATKVQLSYEMAKMLPTNDKNLLTYDQFKKVFGEDGSVIYVGFKDENIFELSNFNRLYDIIKKVEKIEGVEKVLSVTNVYNLTKNDSLQKFNFLPIFSSKPQTQEELDSIKIEISRIRFYENLLFNIDSSVYMTGITLQKKQLHDKGRIRVVQEIKKIFDEYAKDAKVEVHYSGLPYIRTIMAKMIQQELYLFIAISLIISILIMILFFRSFAVVLTSMLVVSVSVVWALGIVSLFDYRITVLIGVLPSLLIIIALENCIYLVNKYHWEYKKTGNKIKSLSQVISKIGFATFMTNATSATGFAAFMFTSNKMLEEFGIVSSINIIVVYILSILLTTIIFSYLKPPKAKDLVHIDRKSIKFILDRIKLIILNQRKLIYIISLIIIGVCAYGITRMQVSGKLVDDIPESHPIYKDLKFFEKNTGGIMPFEISIDTKEENGVFANNGEVINKINIFQKAIKNDSLISQYFSRPVSIAEGISFANQAYNNGKRSSYRVPDEFKLKQLDKYLRNSVPEKDSKKPTQAENTNVFKTFIDSTNQITRVSIQMADITTKEMNLVLERVTPILDSIFPPQEYKVAVTGNSIVFSKGTEFLIGNLLESILIAILLISILMALIFRSFRMIFIAMFINLTPLFVTGSIMGFFNIPIKPSTIIVFSVALGISIDNAILFLSKYRHELKKNKHSITRAVMDAIDEAGISMVYTSIVLVLGFAIFMLSDFGGTKALGLLISITLFVALFFNIIVLPSVLLSLEKFAITPMFEQPILSIEEEDSEPLEMDDDDELADLIEAEKPKE